MEENLYFMLADLPLIFSTLALNYRFVVDAKARTESISESFVSSLQDEDSDSDEGPYAFSSDRISRPLSVVSKNRESVYCREFSMGISSDFLEKSHRMPSCKVTITELTEEEDDEEERCRPNSCLIE
jgi:hypothetical protein